MDFNSLQLLKGEYHNSHISTASDPNSIFMLLLMLLLAMPCLNLMAKGIPSSCIHLINVGNGHFWSFNMYLCLVQIQTTWGLEHDNFELTQYCCERFTVIWRTLVDKLHIVAMVSSWKFGSLWAKGFSHARDHLFGPIYIAVIPKWLPIQLWVKEIKLP